jgi:hypothetical protein
MANDPAWYPDPWRPGQLRWWSGTQWTDQTTAPQAALWPSPPDAPRDLDAEQRAAVWARRAVVGFVLARVTSIVVAIVTFHDVIDRFRRAIERGRGASTNSSSTQLIQTPLTGLLVLSLIGIALWNHKAAEVARNLGYPAKRSSGWVVAGWFVPIVNFWFPYQAVRDCLPPRHPARSKVSMWWTVDLVGSFLAIPIVIVSVFSTPLAFAFTLPWLILCAFEVLLFLQVVDAIADDHAAAINRRGA